MKRKLCKSCKKKKWESFFDFDVRINARLNICSKCIRIALTRSIDTAKAMEEDLRKKTTDIKMHLLPCSQ